MEITHHTWNLRTERYQRSVERGFAVLGLSVAWQPVWSAARRRDIDDARTRAVAAGEAFEEAVFVATMRAQERARLDREEKTQE